MWSSPQEPPQVRMGTCTNCEKEVDMTEHKCFIQRLPKQKDGPRYNKVTLDKVNGRPYKPTKDPNVVQVKKDPPLQVYADFEAVTDEEGKQTPILVCFETVESHETVVCEGPNCTDQLFEKLDVFCEDQDGKPREVIVIFHNLKGYNGMFLLQNCYDTHREVKDQITVGTKILSFKSHDLTFKDSLCFLPFPLSNFPATFWHRGTV